MERSPFPATGVVKTSPHIEHGGAGEARVSASFQPTIDLAPLPGRIAAGEQAALAELYDSTVGKLYGLAHAIVRNAQDAEEVICETYAQVWQSACRYDAARGSVLAWLLAICRSRALDLRRRNQSHRHHRAEAVAAEAESVLTEAEPQAILDALEQHVALRGAMAKLSPARCRLVWLAFFKGMSHEEIASLTQLPRGTVKSHIRRALATLRTELDAQ